MKRLSGCLVGDAGIGRYVPRYATLDEFLNEFRKKCEALRQDIRDDWQRYKNDKNAVIDFEETGRSELEKLATKLNDFLQDDKIEPAIRFQGTKDTAQEILARVNKFKQFHPQCIREMWFDRIIEHLNNIFEHAECESIPKLSAQYWNEYVLKDISRLVKMPEKPHDDPAFEFISKTRKKEIGRKGLLWQSDGMDTLIGKFVNIFMRSAKKSDIQSIHISQNDRNFEYWPINDLCRVMRKHCLDDGRHVFDEALRDIRVNFGIRLETPPSLTQAKKLKP